MKALWIRVDAHMGTKPLVIEAAEALDVKVNVVIGMLVQLWGYAAQHSRRGDLSAISDKSLERIVEWPGRKGRFALYAREHLLDSEGIVREWEDIAGRLDDRRERSESDDGKSTYVYYAADSDVIKIGWSGNPWARINDMRTARPGIRLLATERGTRDLERERHAQFATARTEREWFRFTAEIEQHIQTLVVPTVVTTERTTVVGTVATTDRTTESTTVVPAHPPAQARVGACAHANGTGRNGTERDVTVSSESQGENRADSGLPPKGPPAPHARALDPSELPREAIELVVRYYPRGSDPKRRRDVVNQLIDLLGVGVRYKNSMVRALNVGRLAAKCREVVREGVRDSNAAIVVLLAKLADSTDYTEAQRQADHVERETEQKQTLHDVLVAEQWLHERPDIATSIDEQLEREGLPAVQLAEDADDAPFTVVARRMMRTQLLVTQWRLAGAPEAAHAGSGS